ncbi:MAG TPA: AAA family ATPase, partial [Roseiflexaceae bacterium]|nr:AAA family ATPase [Roseiflexaceae bacterium]
MTRSTAMIGREHERAAVLKYLCDDGESLVTITGVGGSGKTTLAQHVAAELTGIGVFSDGVYLVWLAGSRTAADVPLAIAEALNLALQGLRPALAQLIDALRNKSALLVLDNVEHLLGDEGSALIEMLQQILDSAPGVRMLATSRERLRLQAERVIPLAGLSVPATESGPRL